MLGGRLVGRGSIANLRPDYERRRRGNQARFESENGLAAEMDTVTCNETGCPLKVEVAHLDDRKRLLHWTCLSD